MRALVVDDEAPLARLVAGYLQREGFTVTVGVGLAAVTAACEQTPDVIVLDLMIPSWTAWRRAGRSAPSATRT